MTKTFEELEHKVDKATMTIEELCAYRLRTEKTLSAHRDRFDDQASRISNLEAQFGGHVSPDGDQQVLTALSRSVVDLRCSVIEANHEIRGRIAALELKLGDDAHFAVDELSGRVELLEKNHRISRSDMAAMADTAAMATIDAIANRVRDLEILLEGDKISQEVWRKHKALGVTPNIPEPPVGVLQAINRTFESLRNSIEGLGGKLDARIRETQATMSFITRLERFFGPMLDGKNPPLDGHQIADKAYVDESVARFARAIREEVADSISFVNTLLKAFTEISEFGWKLGDTANTKIIRATQKIVHTWAREVAREQAEDAKTKRPSRVQSLIHAVTGMSNGDRR